MKLHNLLATYRYSPWRKGLNHDLQTAYDNATNHIIIKIAGDRAIAGKEVLREGVIPGLRHYYAAKSLDERKKKPATGIKCFLILWKSAVCVTMSSTIPVPHKKPVQILLLHCA